MFSTPPQPTLAARRRPLAAALIAAGLLGTPAAAHADSIVYIAGGNVWSASPDGSRRVQLTDGGQWHSPTQSDDGTIAAVDGTGKGIQVMTRDGRPLHTITTDHAKSGNGDTFAPNPVQLSFSPDGSKIAYAYVQLSCGIGSTCGSEPQVATLVTDAAATTATPAVTYGYNQGVSGPEWLTNARLIAWGGAYVDGALIDVPGPEHGRRPWIAQEPKDVGDGEVSRDGRFVVSTAEYGANLHLTFYATGEDPRMLATPGPAQAACDSDHDPSVSDPSWSPADDAVAFAESRGINVFRFRSITPGSCDLASSAIVLPGASEPDWGPADPPAARYSGPATGGTGIGAGTGSGTGAGGGTATGTTADGALQVSTTRLRRADLRRGAARLRVRAPRAGRVSVRLTSGATVIATGKATAKRRGLLTVRLGRTSRKALTTLSGSRSLLATATLRTKDSETLEDSRPLRLR